MIIDVHCHVGFSARRVDPDLPRFDFEHDGAGGRPGHDSYFSRRVLNKWGWICGLAPVRRMMRVDWRTAPGDAFDDDIQAFNERHLLDAPGVDGIVLLAFDEFHTRAGRPVGPARRLRDRATDLYASNSLVHAICAAHPERFLFGASVHPYRRFRGQPAESLLPPLKSAGAVLVKWLPIHQNIDATDPRTIAFLRAAADLRLAMLIHYGGEMTLAPNCREFYSPAPLLETLRDLRREGRMPTVIVAHVATPSTRFESPAGYRMLVDAMIGEFRDAPLYADVSGMSGPGRAPWLKYLARNRRVHDKLVWATDFPIPPLPECFWPVLGRRMFALRRIRSWIERDLQLKRALGFSEQMFHNAGEILDLPRATSR